MGNRSQQLFIGIRAQGLAGPRRLLLPVTASHYTNDVIKHTPIDDLGLCHGSDAMVVVSQDILFIYSTLSSSVQISAHVETVHFSPTPVSLQSSCL